jgi:hypothetical protein
MGASRTSLILGSRRALRIETNLSREEVLRRLKERIVPWGGEGLRGSASEDGVSLYIVKSPFRRNSWRPVLDGRVEVTPQGSVLIGTLGLDRTVQLILIVAICVGVLWSVRELITLANGSNPNLTLFHALKGLWVIPAVVVVNYLGRHASMDEGESLDTELRSILEPHVG